VSSLSAAAAGSHVSPLRGPVLLVAGLAVATWLRVVTNGTSVDSAMEAGLLFAALLLGLSFLAGRLRVGYPGWTALGIGILGGAALVGVAWLAHPAARPIGLRPEPFVAWAFVTCAVALAEEVLLRGALFAALLEPAGALPALAVTSLVFALMHVPLYGWSVVPVDFGAGLALGGLRLLGRGVAAPAIAHALADVATWWL
jgi:membrane protease YdiL (CAAX protease family)